MEETGLPKPRQEYKTTEGLRHYDHRPDETNHPITLADVMNKLEYLAALVKSLINAR